MSNNIFKNRLGKKLLLSCAVAAVSVGAPTWALAADFSITTPVATTNGGFVLDGDDSITVTGTGSVTTAGADGLNASGINNTLDNQGTITTSGNYADGIRALIDNTISNSGDITTSGNYAHGIRADDDNTISNSGTITTSGDYTDGIHALIDNTISNSGSITTSGYGAEGIFADADNTISNSGTVTTSGFEAEGIRANDDNVIDNSGDITTSGFYAEGIRTDNGNEISNSGTITTSGDFADGIRADFGNTISNSGDITTSGAGAEGIRANDDNTISNSGSITTSGNYAEGIGASSDNTISNSGDITTSGNYAGGIFAEDDNTISNSGSITTSGFYAEGIFADADNTISNSGTITTSGDLAEGIRARADNTITNSGTITTSGDYAYGIRARDDNEISNSGTITTSGFYAYGIRAVIDNTITNSGTITTSGDYAAGIFAFGGNTISNSGTITTSGFYAAGISAFDGNTITNSGTITTSGDYAYGIRARDDNEISNSGTITTSGDDAYGIRARDDNEISNSGKLVSAQANSFFLGTDNTLNLQAPSFIGGAMSGSNTTVNITSGPSHSILWDLSDLDMAGGMPNLSGSVPIFYNPMTQQVATFEPSGFAASANALADLSGNVSGLIRNRLSQPTSSNGVSTYAPLAYGVDQQQSGIEQRIDQAFEEASSSYAPAGGGWWIAGFGSFGEYEGSGGALDQSFDHNGFAIGYDTVLSPDLSVGALVGYGWGSFDTNSRFADSFDNDADGIFGAVYGQKRMGGGGFVDFSLAGGMLSHSDERFVNDNLAPLGVSQAKASYDSWWLAPEVRVGIDIDGGLWTYTPSAQLRYAMQSIDGYTEKGPSASNAKVGSRDVAVLEARLEIAATRQLDFGSFTARAGYQHREAMGDDSVKVTMIGQTQKVGYDANTGGGFYLGADASIALTGGLSLNLSGEATFGDARTMRGIASLTASF